MCGCNAAVASSLSGGSYLCGGGDVFGDVPQASGATLHCEAVAAAAHRTGRRRSTQSVEGEEQHAERKQREHHHHCHRGGGGWREHRSALHGVKSNI